MSRLTNLSNLRIPHFNSWKSIWFENNKYYSHLFFRDFQLYQYLKGLFYKLKMITDDFYFENLTNDFSYIKVNLFLYKFQIKHFFVQYFIDQFVSYNFFLRFFRYNKFNYFYNLNNLVYLLFINNNNLLLLNQLYYYNILKVKNDKLTFNFFKRYKKKYISLYRINFFVSLLSKRYNRKINGYTLKKKLKKNISYISSLYTKKNNLFYKQKNKLFFLLNFLRNLFYFFLNFLNNINFLFLIFFFTILKKINLLKITFNHFIKIKKFNFKFFYFLKENYRRELERDVFDERIYYDFFYYFFFYFLILNIEKTIYYFTGKNYLFYPQFYFYRKFPSFLSSKLINDYVLFELEKGKKFYQIFKMIQNFQLKEKIKIKQELLIDFHNHLFNSYFKLFNKKLKSNFSFLYKLKKYKKLYSLFLLNKNLFFNKFLKIKKLFEDLYYNEILIKKYPLIGLRIECNGPPKRGRQARLVAYHQIIKDYKLFGKMPNRSILADIDYYQSFARTKQGSIGIKVWIFFYSKTYNSNYKLISIV